MNSKIDLKQFKLFLEEYLPAMDEKIPTIINRGGCGIFAYNLTKVLDQMNVPYNLILFYEPGNTSWRHMNDLQNGKQVDKKLLSIGHAVVEIDGEKFDATGIVNFDNIWISRTIENVKPENLNYFLDNDNWNSIFDRTQVPNIIKYLQDIPNAFANWHQGMYTHTMDDEDEKNLNAYTKKHMSMRFADLF